MVFFYLLIERGLDDTLIKTLENNIVKKYLEYIQNTLLDFFIIYEITITI